MKRILVVFGGFVFFMMLFLGISAGSLWIWSTFQDNNVQNMEGTICVIEGPYYYLKSMPSTETNEMTLKTIPVVKITWSQEENVYRQIPRKIFTQFNSRTSSQIWYAYPEDKLPLNLEGQSVRMKYKIEDIEADKGVKNPIIEIINVVPVKQGTPCEN